MVLSITSGLAFGAYSASNSGRTGGPFLVAKRPEPEADQSPPPFPATRIRVHGMVRGSSEWIAAMFQIALEQSIAAGHNFWTKISELS